MNQALVVGNLQLALNEQRMRTETIGRLLSALDEQQARLGADLSAALGALCATSSPTLVLNVAAADVPPLPSACPTLVRCFGGLEVRVGGGLIDGWRSGKARAVFEYLVAHRRRPVPRDRRAPRCGSAPAPR